MLSFKELRNANNMRHAEWPGSDAIDLPFRAIEVAGEAGEVAEAVKKYLRAVYGIKGSTASRENVSQELGDLVIAVDLLAREMNIDLGEAVMDKFNATSEKYGLKTMLTRMAA